MYYVHSLEYKDRDIEEFEALSDAVSHAEQESWSDQAIGVSEGNDWDSSVLIAISYGNETFYK